MSAVLPEAGLPPPLAWTESQLQRVLSIALACLGFFLPFSTAGVGLAGFAVIVVALLMPQRIWRTQPWREPVLLTGMVLFAYIALRVFAVEGISKTAYFAVNRYHELLVLPLLWSVFRIARRPQAFANGLMAGAMFYGVLHWLVNASDMVSSFMESHRISAGFVLAICSFLFFEHARLKRLPPLAGYGACAFLAMTVIFAGGGRTGYLVLILLLSCAAFRAVPARLVLRMAAAAAFLGVAVLVAASSAHVRERVLETLQGLDVVAEDRTQKASSTDIRLELLRNAVMVARENWLVGTGWVHYPDAVTEVATRRHGAVDLRGIPGSITRNPHNEYLLQLGAGGLPALLLYLLWLGVPMVRALRERRPERPWAGAVGCVAVAFAVGSAFNSALFDFTEGHFYAALMAWLLVRRVQD